MAHSIEHLVWWSPMARVNGIQPIGSSLPSGFGGDVGVVDTRGWYVLVLERTVQCSWTVWFFVMFDMFEVRFWAKMWCLEVFEVWSSCYVTRLVLELTVWCSQTVQFFLCSTCSKFDFGPNCDVRKVRCSDIQCSECSKFGILMFVPRLQAI